MSGLAGASRFWDKFSVKESLRSVPAGPAMNGSRLVGDAAQTRELAATDEAFAKYVVKPNSGAGNHDIGFFSVETPAQEITEYLDAVDPGQLVMEEFLEGDEFCVNGQVDEYGSASSFHLERIAHRLSASERARQPGRLVPAGSPSGRTAALLT